MMMMMMMLVVVVVMMWELNVVDVSMIHHLNTYLSFVLNKISMDEKIVVFEYDVNCYYNSHYLMYSNKPMRQVSYL